MIRPRVLSLLLFSFLVMNCAAQLPPAGRTIDLAASDGATLKATYFAAAKPGPGVLLLHQCNRQRKVWDQLAQQLAGAGINVLTLDLRGFGESSGTPMGELEKWPGDIDAAFQYLVSQPGVKRDVIGVGGASCGVNNSIQTARRHPGEVKSLVLLSGGTDSAGRQFLRQAAELPVLAALADDDEFRATVDVLPWIFSASSNPGKKFVHYATGGHGSDMFAVHPELRGVIVDWYVTTLIKTPGRAPVAKDGYPLPRGSQMLALIDKPGGAAQAAEKLAEARRRDPKVVLFPEVIVNLMGYEHVQSGDIKGALEILKLNATAFPDSPNVYDSLSDAYLADGQKDLARQNARKALELLASDTVDPEPRRNAIRDSAQQKLKQLGDGPQ
ncbi:MAG TPA: alpha/beta fold hydrolase [Candidatus Acidoferrales bacterium]|nr:alpha/beta fold hydrolase [Candidatus Acidoferrales bacterium]